MPRENIHLADERTLIIGWNKADHGGHVQLGLDGPHPFVLCDQDGKPVPWEGELKPTIHTALFADLDRAAINDVIRQLRRARDAAFGRDE